MSWHNFPGTSVRIPYARLCDTHTDYSSGDQCFGVFAANVCSPQRLFLTLLVTLSLPSHNGNWRPNGRDPAFALLIGLIY